MEKRTCKNIVNQQLATNVKAMSNPPRLEILGLLVQGPFSVAEIAKGADISGGYEHPGSRFLRPRWTSCPKNKKSWFIAGDRFVCSLMMR